MSDARDDVSWVNILRDPEAAEYVANLHDGSEVVPTVVTGGGEMISGTAEGIVAQLAKRGH